jgi:hypothetical protein
MAEHVPCVEEVIGLNLSPPIIVVLMTAPFFASGYGGLATQLPCGTTLGHPMQFMEILPARTVYYKDRTMDRKNRKNGKNGQSVIFMLFLV